MTSTPKSPAMRSSFFWLCAFKRSLAVCRLLVIRSPLAACRALPHEPRFWAAWFDCAVAQYPSGPK
eukprot:521078-Heterocapsa_arctica.AAC.1